MTTLADILAPLVWPLCFLLVVLLVLKQVKDDVRPIFIKMVDPLAKQAQDNAADIGRAFLFGMSASLAAWYDVFSQVDAVTMRGMSVWQVSALLAKVANPFIVAFLATLVKPTGYTPPPKLPTQPPFPTP